MNGSKERRRSTRIRLENALIDLYAERGQSHKQLSGRIYDVSTSGVRLCSDEPYAIGSKSFLSLLLPNGTTLSNIISKVLRCEKKDEVYHIALAFMDMDHYQKILVKDYIRLMKLRNEF